QRYLHDEPVLACPPSAGYRFRKFARRNKVALATASVVGLAVLLAVAVLATSTLLIAGAKGDLEEALKHQQRDTYFHRIALAHREWPRDNLRRALEQLDKCPEELQQWEWRSLTRLCRVEPV